MFSAQKSFLRECRANNLTKMQKSFLRERRVSFLLKSRSKRNAEPNSQIPPKYKVKKFKSRS
jgi:hypothetical protein